MLRITTIFDNGAPAILKLEGKLLQPWINELEHAYGKVREWTPRLTLDLTDVSYVDVPGTIALRELRRRGVAIQGCSALIAELLKENHE